MDEQQAIEIWTKHNEPTPNCNCGNGEKINAYEIEKGNSNGQTS